MFPVPLLLALAADTVAVDLDSWVPGRMAALHVAAVSVAVVAGDEHWRWFRGVENVLTRARVSEATIWPARTLGTSQAGAAASHAPLGQVLAPGLIVVGVWSALCWMLLVPVAMMVRKSWRFGRWHEVLALIVAAPIAWLYLRRAAGPVMASYFIGLAGGALLLPIAIAALRWRKSRIGAITIVAAASIIAWQARRLVVPLPSVVDGHAAAGGTLDDLERTAVRALRADSLQRTRLGFAIAGDRWIAHDRSRGAETFFVLLPERETAIVAASNTGGTTGLLRQILDSITR